MEQHKKDYFDLDEIKAIPIEQVCESYGVEVKGHNGQRYCSIRNENTPSVKLYESNTFYDFGSGVGGDVIHLVSYITGKEWYESLVELATLYQIKPLNKIDFKNEFELTNRQYEKINIQADLATKNFDFNVLKYGTYSTEEFAKKYRMPVNELCVKYPEVYHNMLKKKALPYVHNLRNDYFRICYFQDKLYTSCGTNILEDKNNMVEIEAACIKVKEAESILNLAITDRSLLNYNFRTYDIIKDIKSIRSGELSFEVGTVEYATLKEQTKAQGQTLKYVKMPADRFFNSNILTSCTVGAFLKGNEVNIACTPDQFDKIFNAQKEITI